MDRIQSLSFGEEIGEPYRLEIRLDPKGQRHLTLYDKDEIPVEGLLGPSLELLCYLAKRSEKIVPSDKILDAIWRHSAPAIIDTHVSFLRKAFGDDASEPRFIKTLPKRGHMFLLPVTKQGDIGDLEAYPTWNRARFYELLNAVTRDPKNKDVDLRIVATGISSGLAELDLDRLLKKHVRIKMLMMDPANEALTDARYVLRKDKTKEECLDELRTQIRGIAKLAVAYPHSPRDPRDGTLEHYLSNIMPCGFVVQTRDWALLGNFLAHDSYVKGPMLYIPSDSEAWEELDKDWKARWGHAEEQRKK